MVTFKNGEYLLDTNILSELFKKKPNLKVVEWIKSQEHIFTSSIVIEELFYGLSYIRDMKSISWLQEFINYNCTIYDISKEVAINAGIMRGEMRKKGIQRTQSDLLIASTAKSMEMTLVTRNEKDFIGCHIKIYNPF